MHLIILTAEAYIHEFLCEPNHSSIVFNLNSPSAKSVSYRLGLVRGPIRYWMVNPGHGSRPRKREWELIGYKSRSDLDYEPRPTTLPFPVRSFECCANI